VYTLIGIKQNFGKEKNMFKKNKKLILEHFALDNSFPNVEPIKNKIPDWYKKKHKFHNGEKVIKALPAELTFKACSVFSDSFIMGYSIPLAVDIAIQQTEGGPSISWHNKNMVILEARGLETNKELPVPMGCHPQHFAWKTQHVLKVPEGYSAIITHPLNRFDLPFVSLSGIVDGEFVLQDGNCPVYFSKDFEGIIPAGTPILQVLLFKRENWKSEINENLLLQAEINKKKSANAAYGWYKKSHWQKKIYE
jgi:hypothetical protein